MAQLPPPQKVACREYGLVVLPSKLDLAEINRQRAIFDRVFAPPPMATSLSTATSLETIHPQRWTASRSPSFYAHRTTCVH